MSSYARANLRITNEKIKGKFPWGHHVVWNGKTKCTSWKGLLKSFPDIIKVDSIHVESPFDSTQPLCSQLFSGTNEVKIPVSNEDASKCPQLWKHFQYEILLRGWTKTSKLINIKMFANFVYDHTISSRTSKQKVDRYEYSGIPISPILGFPNLPNQTLFPLNLLHPSSIISPPICRTCDFSKLPITQFWLPWDK